MHNNFEVLVDEVVTVRDLKPGELYIHTRIVDKFSPEVFWKYMRIRDDDPFFSKTILQTSIHEYPSEKVYRVRSIEPL